MDIDDSFLNSAKFDSNAIPKNIPIDTLENVDDMSMPNNVKNAFLKTLVLDVIWLIG